MLPYRYNLDSLKGVLAQPSSLVEEAKILNTKLTMQWSNWRFRREYGAGIDVMERDWDNLIILDACRYDYSKEANSIEGELHQVVSKGGTSQDFMAGNFIGRDPSDTVYVTSNPYVDNIPAGTFHDLDFLTDMWNERLGTVRPESVHKRAVKYSEQYPNKRLIVHFMQPHYPYLGPTAQEVRSRFDMERLFEDPAKNASKWFRLVKDGDITDEQLEQMYVETLDAALDHHGRAGR